MMFWPDLFKTLFIIQFIVQTVLVCIVLFLIMSDKKKKIPTDALDELKGVIQQAGQLAESFRNQVQLKTELITKLMSNLDEKIREARLMMEGLEKTSVISKEAKAFSQEDVVRLHNGGFSPVDISQITGIPVGEIQLMVKVKQQDAV